MLKKSLADYQTMVRGRTPIQKSININDSIDVARVGAIPLGSSRSLALATLCLDIRGFTRLSAELEMDKVLKILNIYYPVSAQAVYDHEGIIEKYPGDGLMAHFSLERDGANRTARVAVLLMSLVNTTIAAELRAAGLPSIKCGLGLEAGDNCVLANVGIAEHAEIIAVGNSVNRAAKLEKDARPEGIVLGEWLYSRLDYAYKYACTEIPSDWKWSSGGTYRLYRMDWTRVAL